MEWYAINVVQPCVNYCQWLGAIELIAIAAILIFEFKFKKPEKNK